MALDDRGATPIALVFHELATNASKYGALSVHGGKVAITLTRRGDDVVIDWRESGGPAIVGEPTRVGFGTQLAELSVVQQLGGKLERTWHRDGLNVSLRLSAVRLQRPGGA